MLNSKQMKLAKKAIDQIKEPTITYIVKGVMEDLHNKKHSGAEMLIPMWGSEGTVGAITSKEGWDKDPVILNQLIASCIGRANRFWLIEHGLQIDQASMVQAVELMSMTDEMQFRILKSMVTPEQYKAFMDDVDQPGSVKF